MLRVPNVQPYAKFRSSPSAVWLPWSCTSSSPSVMNRLTVLGFIQTFGQRISEFPVRITSLRRGADQVAYVIDLDPRVAR